MSHFVARESCPVCDRRDTRQIYSVPYLENPVRSFVESHYRDQGHVDWEWLADGRFTVRHCPDCDLIYQQDVPDGPLLGKIYGEMADPARVAVLNAEQTTLAGMQRITGEWSYLFGLTGKRPPDITVLDYGAGTGRWAQIARGLGARVYVTEVGGAREAAIAQGLEVIDEDEIDGRQFDIVHTEQVLEHLVDVSATFGRLARTTSGLLKAAVPPRHRLHEWLPAEGLPAQSSLHTFLRGDRASPRDEAFNAIQPLEHLNAFSTRTMQWLGHRHGLELASQVRKADVSLSVQTSRIGGSLKEMARMAAKMLLRPDRGYYLFRKPGG